MLGKTSVASVKKHSFTGWPWKQNEKFAFKNFYLMPFYPTNMT